METNKTPKMESNLTKQDLELIDKLVEGKLKHYNLIAPIEQQEQPKEEVKERFNVELYHPNITGDEGFKINISPTFKMRKLMAEDIAHKIKALLQTL